MAISAIPVGLPRRRTSRDTFGTSMTTSCVCIHHFDGCLCPSLAPLTTWSSLVDVGHVPHVRRMILDVLPELQHLRLVLASASPRRKDILRSLEVPFEAATSHFEETLDASRFPNASEYSQQTALGKAVAVAGREYSREGPDVVVGADTVVESPSGQVLEKPKDVEEAKRMLRSLSGRSHRVHTGVAIVAPNLVDPGTGTMPYVKTFAETTVCHMAVLSEQLIQAYVDTGDPMDKAGAYGIQSKAGPFVASIQGCYYNVVGFPLHRFTVELRKLVDETELGTQLKGRMQAS